MVAYIETVIAVTVGVGLLLLGTHTNETTIHDMGILVLGSAARSLVNLIPPAK